jgi:hypothetical protein
MSDRTRRLLDKVTARHILTGLLRLAEARDLTAEEAVALSLYEQAGPHGLWQFMVPSTEGVLRRPEERPRYAAIIRLFRRRVEVAFPTRYFKRWTRRLQAHGFTPEDAGVLALATFGTDKEAQILGMHMIVTFDQPMVTQWTVQHTAIQARLTTMQQELLMPYSQASFPEVLLPAQMIRYEKWALSNLAQTKSHSDPNGIKLRHNPLYYR